MKQFSFLMLLLLVISSCGNKTKEEHEHDHPHEAGGLESLAFTLYSDKTELFVEFKPLVVGTASKFAAHFTVLGENFTSLDAGKVTLSLIVGEDGIRTVADSSSSPGIFRLALSPKKTGVGKLIFDIETKDYTDRIIIENVMVYADEKEAMENLPKEEGGDNITYLKEQAWKVEFANMPVVRSTFNAIIKTNGQLLPAAGDETIVTANTSGIVFYSGGNLAIGSEVNPGAKMFTISGSDLTQGNADTQFKQVKVKFDKAKKDFERAEDLVKDKIISEKEFLQSKADFESTQAEYLSISKNYSSSGQSISSASGGFIKNILVTEGQFVESGAPLAIISKNERLLLQANVSQKYFGKLSSISSANFKSIEQNTIYSTEDLNGRLISFGKSASTNSPFIPITFEIDNSGNLIPGSVMEVYLKSTSIPNALLAPVSSLIEEQGVFYVYVQTGGESFQKREVKIGESDGKNVQLLSGVSEGERVVTKGTYQIKLSTAAGTLPAHGHEH